MGKLLNVRLSAEEAAMVVQLRRNGTTASAVVRQALREEFARQSGFAGPASPVQLLEGLHEKYPAPAGWKGRRVDATDRRAVAAFLRARLKAAEEAAREGRMIWVDSSVLVALCDRSDPWSGRAMEQLGQLAGKPLGVTVPVLTETWHLLERAWLRKILVGWLRGGGAAVKNPVEEREAMGEVWRWLEKYAEHEPDFADGYLMIAAAEKKSSVWTYDREFTQVWRGLDGGRVRLAFPIR